MGVTGVLEEGADDLEFSADDNAKRKVVFRTTRFIHNLTLEDTSWNISGTSFVINLLNTSGVKNITDIASSMSSAHDASAHDESKLAPNEDFYENSRIATGLYCFPILCLFGIIGNVLSLIVFNHRAMRNSTNVYLSALAVSDLIKLTNDVLYFITTVLFTVSEEDGHKAYSYLYPYSHFIFNMSVCVSSWLVVSVATERYILVCQAALAKRLCSRGRAIAASSIVFTLMTLIAVPTCFRYKTVYIYNNITETYDVDVNVTELWQNETFSTAYIWVQNLLRSVIPLIILVVMNILIIRALRQTRANKKNAARHRITFMLIVVIIVFLFCITPDALISTIFGYGYHETEDFLVKGIREITDMLLAVNAAINFILYTALNMKFRQVFLVLFCKSCYLLTARGGGSQNINGIEPEGRSIAQTDYRQIPSTPNSDSLRRSKKTVSPGSCSPKFPRETKTSPANHKANNGNFLTVPPMETCCNGMSTTLL